MASNNESALRTLAAQVANLSVQVALEGQSREEAEAALQEAHQTIARLQETAPVEGVVVDGS